MFKSHTVVIAFTGLALLTGPALAKRGAPKIAKPLIAGNVEYRAVHDRYREKGKPKGIRAFVEARDAKTKKSLWRVMVYDIRYRPALETDVQDVYIKALKLDALGLLATDERGRRCLVNGAARRSFYRSIRPRKDRRTNTPYMEWEEFHWPLQPVARFGWSGRSALAARWPRVISAKQIKPAQLR